MIFKKYCNEVSEILKKWYNWRDSKIMYFLAHFTPLIAHRELPWTSLDPQNYGPADY